MDAERVSKEQIMAKAQEFNVDAAWAIDRKAAYIGSLISDLQKAAVKWIKDLKGRNANERALLLSMIEEDKKQVDVLKKYVKYLKSTSASNSKAGERISPDMIDRAREYPISNIIDINRAGFALCVEHDDATASMYCKGNFAHCFTCGYSADVIALTQRVKGFGFVESVKFLTGDFETTVSMQS